MKQIKPLSVLGDELEKMLDNYSFIQYRAFPQVCHSCHKLIVSPVELEFMYHIGTCPACDHSYGEDLYERSHNV